MCLSAEPLEGEGSIASKRTKEVMQMQLCAVHAAVQMSFVALELLLGPLLAGMMAGCVLVCSTCWSGRVHCLA